MFVTRQGGWSHIKLHANLVSATILHFNLCETLSSSCNIKWQFAYCATQMSDLKSNFTALHAKAAILKRYYLLVLLKPTQLSKGVKFWTHARIYILQPHSRCWYLIGFLRSCDVVPTCLFNLSLFGPVRRSNRTTENSNQATQIALQLDTHACLSAFKVSKDNSIQPDIQICCYLNKTETENVFYICMYFHTPSFWNSLDFFPLSHWEVCFSHIKIQTTTSFRFYSKSICFLSVTMVKCRLEGLGNLMCLDNF